MLTTGCPTVYISQLLIGLGSCMVAMNNLIGESSGKEVFVSSIKDIEEFNKAKIDINITKFNKFASTIIIQ